MSPLAAAAEVGDLAWRQLVRSKQLIGIGLAIAFAAGMALLIYRNDGASAENFQSMELFVLSTVIVPLIALLFGTGAMATERENGTLAYLFTRPFPRAMVVLAKGIAAIAVANATVLLCVLVVYVASGAPPGGEPWGGAAALMLETTALTALFVAFGTLLARSLYLGLAYIALFEGLLGNTVGARSGWSITYHARNLLSEWSGSGLRAAGDNLGAALPGTASASVGALLAVAIVAIAVAAGWVETREYGLKDRTKEE